MTFTEAPAYYCSAGLQLQQFLLRLLSFGYFKGFNMLKNSWNVVSKFDRSGKLFFMGFKRAHQHPPKMQLSETHLHV